MTEKGQVFSWGNNSNGEVGGQLATESGFSGIVSSSDASDDSTWPQKVETPSHLMVGDHLVIKEILAGDRHVIVKT